MPTASEIRTNAETSFAYRNGLLKAASRGEWLGTTDCSTAAAEVLAVMQENCIVDQISLAILEAKCRVQGLGRALFIEALEELEDMDVLWFFINTETGTTYAKTMDHFGRQVRIDASEAVQ